MEKGKCSGEVNKNKEIWGPCLAISSCYNKVPWTGWLINNRIYLSPFWRLEAQDQGASIVWFWWVPSSGLHTVDFTSHGEEMEQTLCSLLNRALIPFTKAPPKYLPKAHLQIPSNWRLDFNMWISGGHKHSVHNTGCTSLISVLMVPKFTHVGRRKIPKMSQPNPC